MVVDQETQPKQAGDAMAYPTDIHDRLWLARILVDEVTLRCEVELRQAGRQRSQNSHTHDFASPKDAYAALQAAGFIEKTSVFGQNTFGDDWSFQRQSALPLGPCIEDWASAGASTQAETETNIRQFPTE